jgi:formylglycine-generating enzyme required for sulfatase activity
MKMKNLSVLTAFFAIFLMASCKLGGKSGRGLPDDGQLHGVAPASAYNLQKPPNMVYIPPGTFHMGPSDEDMNYSFTSRNQQISISGFWMDATEITNNQYRQFTNWVRDSIAATQLQYGKDVDGRFAIDWKKAATIKWSDKATIEKISAMIVEPDNRVFGRKELDPNKLVFHSETFDLNAAAQKINEGKPRSQFIMKRDVKVYPDTLVWIRDFSYSYNEPMTKRYYSHPAFGNYPVVGVNWIQASTFCEWRTQFLNAHLEAKHFATESSFRLPTESEWEYAARGGRSQSMYPWGNYYLRNKRGCLLANFKPGRGNYPEDGGFYTVRADAYWPNDFGLYCMAGNVAEWTSSFYYEGASNFEHDMNPDIRWNAKDTDPPRMKRKVIRGGSWKDVGIYLQTSARTYEYQDTAKSYIGFRCVIDLAPTLNGNRR